MFSAHFGSQKCVTSWNPQRVCPSASASRHTQINFLFCFYVALLEFFSVRKTISYIAFSSSVDQKMRHPPWQCHVLCPAPFAIDGRRDECRCTFPIPFAAGGGQRFFAIFLAVALTRPSWLGKLGKVLLYFSIPLKGTTKAEGSQMESMAHKLQF